eukprot:TRINITY_DN1472_c0_g1_i1.p1 TRINITY_DN1472_c0_g1~~TRINITY_DN1472_c0_g1_i1.p1  ORF type:complete len:194 (+),score=35.46 TRINITY_DN1472_c0_g1_i1:105-686(+)
MFIVNWFYNVLNYLGLYYKNAKILFLGLDNAGKTTLLQMLRDRRLASHTQTLRPNSETLCLGKIRFQAHDLGGHETVRALWVEYFSKTDAVVFLVDANDRRRFDKARAELDKLLQEDSLAHAPFLILGNKIDLAGAAPEAELRDALGLSSLTTGKMADPSLKSSVRPIELFMCSVVNRSGYAEGFRWLAEYLE